MKKDKMRLKGQLGMYMKWPLIMTLLLFAMNIWMYMIDKKSRSDDDGIYCDLSDHCILIVFP